MSSDETEPTGQAAAPELPLELQHAAELQDAPGLLSAPGFLHPSSIFFDIASHLRRFLLPAIVAIYSAASGGMWGLGIGLLIFSLAILGTIFRYFTLRYRIDGYDFVVTEGLIFRRVRSVPVRRIQNVDLIQNPLHRLFGVAEVRIETASGTEPEATLRVLTHAQIEELRQAIFGHERAEAAEAVEPPGVARSTSLATGEIRDEQVAAIPLEVSSHAGSGSVPRGGASASGSSLLGQQAGELLHQIPLRNLLAAGLASNRGMVLLGIVFGLYFQSGYTGDKFFSGWLESGWKQVERLLPGNSDYLAWTLAVLAGLLVLFLVLRLVGVAWYVLRFYGHRIERRGNDLRVSCGLLTKVSATVPRKRIQFVSIHRPLIFRWMGLASIRIETAGGGSSESEDATSTVSRRWFLPVLAERDIPRLLAELRPGIVWDESQFAWRAVSPRMASRLMRGVVLVSLLLAGVGMFNWTPWGGLVGVVAFMLLAWLTVKKSRSIRYARTEWGVVYRSGMFTRKLSIAFYDRIQSIELVQTPFDRRWRMAQLRVDTAAAGPADHAIDAHYLDADFAFSQFRELQEVAAHNKPVWV